jgi:hypothetical protein
MLFDLGGTANSRNFAHVCARRQPVHGSLALGNSQVHRLVMIFKIPILLWKPKIDAGDASLLMGSIN